MFCHLVATGETDAKARARLKCQRQQCGRSVWSRNPPGKTWMHCLASSGTPGEHLRNLLTTLGIKGNKCPGMCKEMASKMDEWGTAGCREHKAEIVAHHLSPPLT